MDLSIIIVNYNSKKFLAECLKSIPSNNDINREVIIINNDSNEKNFLDSMKLPSETKIIHCEQNTGFAGGNNIGIKMARGNFILLINPDIILTKNFIPKLFHYLKSNPMAGAVTGKLIRYDFNQNKPTDVIDSTGHIIKKNRRVFDRGQNEKDCGQYDKTEEVFGACGAAVMFNKKALEDCKVGGEYFDELFFAYKEDVDLSWRMRLMGWKIYYIHDALAYHGRGTGALSDKSSFWEIMKNRKKVVSNKVKIWSYRNQRMMQIKNELWGNFFHNFFSITIREFLTFSYVSVIEPSLILGFFQIFPRLPKIIKKRREIMRRKKTGWRQMRIWFK